ncbi:hypothetical protein ADIS_2904 [Lunatimonas lonarensis]|uniref:Uncharacterized protein n=1 Tax=Lunatimonas lonarensis TaxID=1232681 RepID=R7ZR12_9BACT|nr:hypothetical protein ADIS_2904 [Lunatimonas lonarensis]
METAKLFRPVRFRKKRTKILYGYGGIVRNFLKKANELDFDTYRTQVIKKL